MVVWVVIKYCNIILFHTCKVQFNKLLLLLLLLNYQHKFPHGPVHILSGCKGDVYHSVGGMCGQVQRRHGSEQKQAFVTDGSFHCVLVLLTGKAHHDTSSTKLWFMYFNHKGFFSTVLLAIVGPLPMEVLWNFRVKNAPVLITS